MSNPQTLIGDKVVPETWSMVNRWDNHKVTGDDSFSSNTNDKKIALQI